MVALDDEGRPTRVPAVAAEQPDEQRRGREAQLRRDNRLAERAHINESRG
jgi:acyl-CoA hydrolase